jgi:hypothetical protein
VPDFRVEKSPVGPEAQIAKEAQSIRKFKIIRHNHPALPGRDNLVGIKAEAPHVSEAAHATSGHFGTMSLSSILYDVQAAFPRQCSETAHVDRMTKHMHRHQCPRLGRNPALDLV